jgi:hypothetical protein
LDALNHDLFRGNIIEFAVGETETGERPEKRFGHIVDGTVAIRLIAYLIE